MVEQQRVRREGRVNNTTTQIKGSKSKAIALNQLRYPKTNTQFPDAIQKNKHVLALMRDNKTWELAIIMEVRVKPAPDSDDEACAETTQSTDVAKTKTDQAIAEIPKSNQDNGKLELSHHRSSDEFPKNYDYYVNYLQLERRNNRWISEDMIETNPELISKALDKFEKEKKADEAAG